MRALSSPEAMCSSATNSKRSSINIDGFCPKLRRPYARADKAGISELEKRKLELH